MIAFIEAQGSLLSMKVRGFKPRTGGYGGKRGIIQTFSQASRRRLLRFMARLKVRKIRATFITLTFKEMVSHENAKRAFKRFTMRLRRAFPTSSVVWRLEYQPKRGAIHYHLLCFNLPFWKQKELQTTWEACTGEVCSIVDIRLVHGARSVMAYVAKYIAKVDQEPTSLDDGAYQHAGEDEPPRSRFWGYINKELLPLGEVVTGVLTDRQTIKSLSSLAWSILGSDNPYNSLSFHLFCDNARWLCERAIEEGGCVFDEWEFSVKDHSTPHATHSPYTEHFSERELEISNRLSFGRMSRPSAASALKPSTWLKKADRISSFAARMVSEFALDGIIVSICPVSKERVQNASL
jgi:hypothetical protein